MFFLDLLFSSLGEGVVAVVMLAVVQERRQEKSPGRCKPGLESLTWPSGASRQSHGSLQVMPSQLSPECVSSPSLLLPSPGGLGFSGAAGALHVVLQPLLPGLHHEHLLLPPPPESQDLRPLWKDLVPDVSEAVYLLTPYRKASGI